MARESGPVARVPPEILTIQLRRLQRKKRLLTRRVGRACSYAHTSKKQRADFHFVSVTSPEMFLLILALLAATACVAEMELFFTAQRMNGTIGNATVADALCLASKGARTCTQVNAFLGYSNRPVSQIRVNQQARVWYQTTTSVAATYAEFIQNAWDSPVSYWSGIGLYNCNDWSSSASCDTGVGGYSTRKNMFRLSCDQQYYVLCMCSGSTNLPTKSPSASPTASPTTSRPTKSPSTSRPTGSPSRTPTRSPSRPTTHVPSRSPTPPTTFAPTPAPHRFGFQAVCLPGSYTGAYFAGVAGADAACRNAYQGVHPEVDKVIYALIGHPGTAFQHLPGLDHYDTVYRFDRVFAMYMGELYSYDLGLEIACPGFKVWWGMDTSGQTQSGADCSQFTTSWASGVVLGAGGNSNLAVQQSYLCSTPLYYLCVVEIKQTWDGGITYWIQ